MIHAVPTARYPDRSVMLAALDQVWAARIAARKERDALFVLARAAAEPVQRRHAVAPARQPSTVPRRLAAHRSASNVAPRPPKPKREPEPPRYVLADILRDCDDPALTTVDIAKRHGLTPPSVANIARRHGKPRPRHRFTAEDRGHRRTVIDLEAVLALYNAGISASEVARRLGLNKSTLVTALNAARAMRKAPPVVIGDDEFRALWEARSCVDTLARSIRRRRQLVIARAAALGLDLTPRRRLAGAMPRLGPECAREGCTERIVYRAEYGKQAAARKFCGVACKAAACAAHPSAAQVAGRRKGRTGGGS